ncbi:putative acyl carrier protein [Pseudoramibacter alactolyticus ATCC 23263]|uniref:Acyl carrier protein n=2 Tax=Pseudoramibacter TaxID=113286 RepID=E6MIV5_9FIRM|nr:putative acyl carrier protein [Pseudoramibacter alactolyticus ATCC 23263]
MDVMERLGDLIGENYNLDHVELREDTRLIEDLHLDSLDMVEMVVEIEDAFDIVIPEEKMEAMENIGDVVGVIEALSGK